MRPVSNSKIDYTSTLTHAFKEGHSFRELNRVILIIRQIIKLS